jgi:hypothetical protein
MVLKAAQTALKAVWTALESDTALFKVALEILLYTQ